MEFKSYLYLLLVLLFVSTIKAEATKTIFNPYTGKLDYITNLEKINGVNYVWPAAGPDSDGLCLSGTATNPVVLSWTSCSGGTVTPASPNYALLEDTGFLLVEDGTKLLLQK